MKNKNLIPFDIDDTLYDDIALDIDDIDDAFYDDIALDIDNLLK